MLPEGKLVGAGGCFYFNDTTYDTSADPTKNTVNAIAVHGAPVISELEDKDGDALAKYGLDGTPTLVEGMLITAKRDKPFTKIVFSTADAVMLYTN